MTNAPSPDPQSWVRWALVAFAVSLGCTWLYVTWLKADTLTDLRTLQERLTATQTMLIDLQRRIMTLEERNPR